MARVFVRTPLSTKPKRRVQKPGHGFTGDAGDGQKFGFLCPTGRKRSGQPDFGGAWLSGDEFGSRGKPSRK